MTGRYKYPAYQRTLIMIRTLDTPEPTDSPVRGRTVGAISFVFYVLVKRQDLLFSKLSLGT